MSRTGWTSIPYDPSAWRTDGRMYPPQPDNVNDVDGYPRLTGLRTRKNMIYIGDNGSIEIRRSTGEIDFQKVGADGRGVWDLD